MPKPSPFVEIPLDSQARKRSGPPSQFTSEKEKDAFWCYQNAKYVSSFYNQQSDNIGWPMGEGGAEVSDFKNRLQPVAEMIRMLRYYLGEQTNMSYAFVEGDETGNTMQALWTQSQTVKEFVDFFRGTMRGRLSNVQWNAKPISRRATSAKTDMYDKAMLAHDLKPYLNKIAEQAGATFNPTGQDFELPEDVQKWMDTTWKEFGSEVFTDLADGIWFSDKWLNKCMNAFMYVVATANCAMHFYARDGRMTSEVLMPYQQIMDLRVDDDYGTYDELCGKVGNATPYELKKLFPELTDKQIQEIETKIGDANEYSKYNEVGPNNMQWWSNSKGRGTITYTISYWRTKHFTGLKEVKRDKDRQVRVAKTDASGEADFILDDIYQTVTIGNFLVGQMGYIDNMVESFGEVARPMMPIIRYRPNTVLGQSVSEVKRISALVDECDYYAYKIKQAVGKMQGKVYVIYGEKFTADDTPKEFIQNLKSIGITVKQKTTGEADDENAGGKLLEEIDWSLDPNINKLWELINMKEEKMRRVMSTSDLAMGQMQNYFGGGTVQTAIGQNNIGTAPLFDGFTHWIVICMTYMTNASKNLMVLADNDEYKEMQVYLGERGLVFINIDPAFSAEQIGVSLRINDIIDDQKRKDILGAAVTLGQTTGFTFDDYLTAYSEPTVTAMQNSIEFSNKKKKKDMQQQQQQDQVFQQQNIQTQQMGNAMIADSKEANENYRKQMAEENANYRKELEQITKGVLEQMKAQMAGIQPPQVPAPVPLAAQLQQQDQAAQQQQTMSGS